MICNGLTREQSNALYAQVLKDGDVAALRRLCREDLFFLLTVACCRKDINRDWLYDRCREVEENPDGCLDLWAREHYKSTIITFGLTLKDILASHGKDPDPRFEGYEITVGIFSHTRPIAKAFLSQIKEELEKNTFLQELFPDILYKNPRSEASKWSIDSGIMVKRRSNSKEATVEAWGLVDSQPTSKHFWALVYDDVVTLDSVTTPDQIEKTNTAWEMSLNLGADGGVKRYIGTRYRHNDTYKLMLDREIVEPRIYPATDNGEIDGEPVFLSKESLDEKRKAMGVYVFGSQMLQNPFADNAMGFKEEWLNYYDQLKNRRGWNVYITVDPAGEKKKNNDYTVIEVNALAPDGNYYLLAGIRDRMNLTERTKKLFDFVREYKPVKVGYEKYGLQADIDHIKFVMQLENYRFDIVPLGGQMPKNDRIRRLVPVFERGQYYLPRHYFFVDYEGKQQDYTALYVEEYLSFPLAVHDDMGDCKSRILDKELGAVFPRDIAYVLDNAAGGRPAQTMLNNDYDVLAL